MSANCIVEHPSEPNRNWCTVCGVSLSRSERQVLQHVQSAKHARTAQQPERRRQTIQKKRQRKAELCQAAKHVARANAGHAGSEATAAAAAMRQDESKQASPVNSSSAQPRALSTLPSNRWHCEVCAREIMAHSRASHEAGKDHRRKMTQRGVASAETPPPGWASVVPRPRPTHAPSRTPAQQAAASALASSPASAPPRLVHPCPVCRESFAKKKDLDRHVRTAAGAGHRRHRAEQLYVDMPVAIAHTQGDGDDSPSNNMCISCDEAPAHVRCPSCSDAIYCGRECQRDDWRWTHRDACAAIHSAEELAARAAERAYEEEQDEAREIYREWHGYYDGNSGYAGGDD